MNNKEMKNDLPLSLQSVEDLKKSIDGWINNADVKAAAVLAFNGAIITVLATKLSDLKKIALSFNCTDYLPVVIIAFSMAYLWTFGVSVYYVFKTLKPDTTPQTRSLFFFGSISSMPLENFQEKVSELKETEAQKMLSEQIHTNSKIVSNKFKNVNKSVSYLFLSIIFFVLSFLLISIF